MGNKTRPWLKSATALHLTTLVTLTILVQRSFSSDICNRTSAVKKFYPSCICDLSHRQSLGCTINVPSQPEFPVVTTASCLRICARFDDCYGASFYAGECYIHWMECPHLDTSCRSVSIPILGKIRPFHQISHPMARVCDWSENSGTMNVIQSCNNIAGNSPGYYNVLLDPGNNYLHSLPVTCEINENGEGRVVFLSNQGNRDFNKTWDEYRWGFYFDQYNFWAGLETLFTLSAYADGMMNLIIKVIWRSKPPSSIRYKQVTVSNPDMKYEFNYNSWIIDNNNSTPVMQQCFTSLNRYQPFSTKDRDDEGNCANSHGHGWWHYSSNSSGHIECMSSCNLLGWSEAFRSTKPSESIMMINGLDLIAEAGEFERVVIMLEYPLQVTTERPPLTTTEHPPQTTTEHQMIP